MSFLTLTKPRLSPSEYVALCVTHFKRWWMHYTLPVAVVLVLSLFIRIDVNYTDSLPDHVFVTVKGWKTGLKHGDYVTYKFPTENHVSPFRKGAHMVKIVGGVAGDTVKRLDSGEYVVLRADASDALKQLGGVPMGVAKPYSRSNKPLESGPVGVIPEGSYYVFAPHKDSLDSRYAMVGWISSDTDILGRTFPLF